MKFEIGDIVYAAETITKRVEEVCPVCNGDKEVMMVLGDGTQVMLNCRFCAPGYDPPRGWIYAEYIVEPSAKKIYVEGIRTDVDRETKEIEVTLQHGSRLYDVERYIALTYEEAFEKAVLLAEKGNQRYVDQRTATGEKAKRDKSYTWHVGYHMRAAKSAREEAERHEKSARIMESIVPAHLKEKNE